MKFMDILKEERRVITDKERKNTRAIYNALKTGIYRPYPDSNKVKYVLPDLEEYMIRPDMLHNQITIAVDFNKVGMYIITKRGEVDVFRISDDGGAVVRNIKHRIMKKFEHYNVKIMDYFA